ncbi:hypothetical protein MXB_575 [Myxobolus squamalis]|nr:hypothetical protein MXB_575 [Myxobolus squamalis]
MVLNYVSETLPITKKSFNFHLNCLHFFRITI